MCVLARPQCVLCCVWLAWSVLFFQKWATTAEGLPRAGRSADGPRTRLPEVGTPFLTLLFRTTTTKSLPETCVLIPFFPLYFPVIHFYLAFYYLLSLNNWRNAGFEKLISQLWHNMYDIIMLVSVGNSESKYDYGWQVLDILVYATLYWLLMFLHVLEKNPNSTFWLN